jgi:ATP-dependent DNA ligase
MNARFPALSLAVSPPLVPMEAEAVAALPSGAGWQYEPKWDGFRCLAFRDGRTVVLQSKSGEPLTRFFPELVMSLEQLDAPRFVLDGEIVVRTAEGGVSWADLQSRMHPSARKVAQLSARLPATLIAFDLLAEGDEDLSGKDLGVRRKRLERLWKASGAAELGEGSRVLLSPATGKRSEAMGWLGALGPAGVDGIVAKRKDAPYTPGARSAMAKYKPERSADCVVGGFRRGEGGRVSALLLGLYDGAAKLHYVGTTLPLGDGARDLVAERLVALVEPPGFTGRMPGPASGGGGTRAPGASLEVTLADDEDDETERSPVPKKRDWEPVRPGLVCEVRFERATPERFRGAPIFLRLRDDKKPAACTLDELRPPAGTGGTLAAVGL